MLERHRPGLHAAADVRVDEG